MLKQLYIKNFALIDELDIRFNPGFSVITGETGAGKSIIIGAISLLLGHRADSKQIKSGVDKCVVEAHFDLSQYGLRAFFNENDVDYDEEDCILRRELNANGKSRAFINDMPVQLSVMRSLGERLVDIHSQHQNLLLRDEDFQINTVDTIAKDSMALADYRRSYSAYNRKVAELEKLKVDIEQSRKEEEFIRFQYNEISNAGLEDVRQEQLEQECETLSHIEEIKTALFEAGNILNGEEYGIVGNVKAAAQCLHAVEEVYPAIKDIAARLDSAHIELKDIAMEIGSGVDGIDFDPSRLDAVNTRLDAIYALERKFRVNTIEELLGIQADLKTRLDSLDNCDDELAALADEVERLRMDSESLAGALTALRKKAARIIEKEMGRRLVPLGIPDVRFEIDFEQKQLSPNGCDRIRFLFSANKNTPLQPVSHVASGGEVSRVMLSLKAMISGAVNLPTIIFDEIDTGISGGTAGKMASIMKEMGRNDRQVISITHLPQIAALGSTHYKVYKEDTGNATASRLCQLDDDGRIREIARMLSGDGISEAAIDNAKELLK